jgi:hypothetical protein
VKRVLEGSLRWNRQRLAALEAADFELRRLFAVLYLISSTSALIYMAGWLRFNILDLPDGPPTYSVMIGLGMTSLAGILHVALLPAIGVCLGVELLMQRRVRRFDEETASNIGAGLATPRVQIDGCQPNPFWANTLARPVGQDAFLSLETQWNSFNVTRDY